MIIAKNIHKYYDSLHVLKGVDLHIKQGEIVIFMDIFGNNHGMYFSQSNTIFSSQTNQQENLNGRRGAFSFQKPKRK